MKATDRVVEVLCLFTAIRPERSTAEVAEGLGMAHSSAHELLNGLARTGLLRKRAPGRFRLGPMINSLVEVLASTDLVLEASRESVVEMAETYGETVHVIELMGSRLLSLTGQEGSSQVHVASAIVSANLPVHLVAPGRLLLSHLPAQQVERMVKEFGDETGPAGRTASSEQLLAELADIRADNYACEAGRYLPDLATVAAPIRTTPICALPPLPCSYRTGATATNREHFATSLFRPPRRFPRASGGTRGTPRQSKNRRRSWIG